MLDVLVWQESLRKQDFYSLTLKKFSRLRCLRLSKQMMEEIDEGELLEFGKCVLSVVCELHAMEHLLITELPGEGGAGT